MEEIIAKRYVKALCLSLGEKETLQVSSVLKPLISAFCSQRFLEILTSPFLQKHKKATFVWDIIEAESNLSQLGLTIQTKIKNFVALLAQYNRLNLLPEIYNEIIAITATQNKEYLAYLYSYEKYEDSFVEKVEQEFSKKLGVRLRVEQKTLQQKGILFVVEDLGLEVSFSPKKFQDDLRTHILKAF